MEKKLFYKDKQPIGLDISLTGLKVMSVDPHKWLVEGYGSVDLDPALVYDALESNSDKDNYISNNLRHLIDTDMTGKIPSNHVVIGLPTNKTFSRMFSLPANQEKALSDAVEIEVTQYIPIPIEMLYVDYEIIERTKDRIDVIMAAIPRKLVDASIKIARSAGLRPVAVEPSINAIARLLETTEEAKLTTLIIDIGQANTDIAVLSRGTVRLTGGVGIGGNTFTIDISKQLNVPLDEAHQLKILNGLSPGPKQKKIRHALKPNLDQIAVETRKVLRYYNERIDKSDKIEQVIIVGAGSNVPGIGEYFTDELVMPARVASPWQQLDFGKLNPPNKQFRSRYITVAGLASIPYEAILT